jgi:hypothetical protein
MQGWTVHEVDPALEVAVEHDLPALRPALEREVEQLWQAARARLGTALFNGQVFSADRIAPRRVGGHFTEFRRIVAQVARPDLFAELGLRPLAVNGIVRVRDGVLIGRRSLRTAYQAGMWQLPPAGSVDAGAADAWGRIDLVAQLLKELHEEVGIVAERSAVGRPLCIVEHPGSHVLDIGIPIEVPIDAAVALSLHARAGNGEYEPVCVVPHAELATFLAGLGGAVVPPARTFLARLGWLGPWDADGPSAGARGS